MNFERFIDDIKNWGNEDDLIEAIILVGSYARGANKPTSDVDLVILASEKSEIIANPNIFSRFGEIKKYQVEYYGALISVRVWYKNGFEVEYGVAEHTWISLPLDSGTRKVLNDGYKVIVDKCGYLTSIECFL